MVQLRPLKGRDRGDKLKIFGPAILITIIGFVVAYQYVAPAPPRTLIMATGSATGAYFAAGKSYREILAKDGVRLELRNTSGSVENLRLLKSQDDGADVAFVQGGLNTLAVTDHLVALGSLFFEPMWVFHRADVSIEKISDLRFLRIAVGPQGSGSKVVALQMLDLNEINEANTRILSYDSQKAADMLLNGEIDVAFFVASPRSEYILQLFKSRSVKLIGIDRAV